MVNRCILSAISHPPILPIQTPILYRLRQMPDFDMFRIIQVGYRAGDFQDTVIGLSLIHIFSTPQIFRPMYAQPLNYLG